MTGDMVIKINSQGIVHSLLFFFSLSTLGFIVIRNYKSRVEEFYP